jgi:hypothetical protein
MKVISRDAIIKVSKDQVSCDMGGETAILNGKSGMYYGLNAIGSRVWDLIQEPKCFDEVLRILLEEYDVEPLRCERDLLSLLEQLAEQGLIEPNNATAD